MENLLLYAHAGSRNHGCEAIVRSTLKILNLNNVKISLATFRQQEDLSFLATDFNLNMLEYKKYEGLHPIRLFDAGLRKLGLSQNMLFSFSQKAIIDTMDKNTLCLSIGGDNYCYGIPRWIYYTNRMAAQKGCKTVFWGCSVDPGAINREMLEDLKRYSLIIARESITYQAFIENGLTNSVLLPDPAFTLDTKLSKLPEGFISGNTIGINVSPLIMKNESTDGIVLRSYINLIQHIIDTTDSQLALIPHVLWEHDNDMIPLCRLYDIFKDTGRVILIDGNYNCMELKGFISRCKLFIGARTHATIAAYSTCVPTLVIGYSVKARGIAKDIFGSEDRHTLPVQKLEQENQLIHAYNSLSAQESDIRQHLSSFMPEYIGKAYKAGEYVRKLGIS
ncbi:polysaccharide pyruvyl transferase WcaK-like protein [Ruminiclostridium sufflavum DSM 19573]|uniref:Polysaccharide pyruvyl transferase WcaK-like protein n=1 Tax=Ruminiclostridium sufflavum DSM 19573 TaxID=1121337 RepID=A0A318XZ52_9FIRM|nr:polysaccharide pyruvyl transferase family protein [Ruminiclostridium sufflavum]PYG88200.1 polysaccharide pyruvyl transferase WcaK-like protein [Ruminiclostridium sufflavum DSM 19573]